jgi:uncharacterized protein with HEPN domain
MNREINKLLADIYKSITVIEAHLENVSTLSAYKSNLMVNDAVERRLAIIGEAMWKADKIDKELAISKKKKIISLRHIIIHDYDIVEDSSIWMIVRINLIFLKRKLNIC